MGRARKHFTNPTFKYMDCSKCGETITVSGDTVEVKCDKCLCGLRRLRPSEMAGPTIAEQKIIDQKKKEDEQREKERIAEEERKLIEKENKKKTKKEKKIKQRSKKKVKQIKPLREKKGKKMKKSNVKNMDVVGGSSKRGRKPSVGGVILDYLHAHNGPVNFSEILNVYSAEREKLGKKGTTELETRNCRSTLYIMCKNGKVVENQKKSLYSAL